MTDISRPGAIAIPAPDYDGEGWEDESRQWDVLLQRKTPPSIESVAEKYRAAVAGKRLLVTGAGGWIGSALARAAMRGGAREIVLLDAAEGAVHEIAQTLFELDGSAHPAVLASVCDAAAIDEVFARYRPQIVFHAAALKHVPLMESNPFAVVANNAIGTYILATAAAKHNSEQMVMVSTDKAVDPFSLMGASKRVAELLMLTRRSGTMRAKVVRLGNVLGSTGSIVPLFLRQIARGGPVTVTHTEVRRYFMTLPETVEALLAAISPGCPAGLLAPEPGAPIRVLDLAKYLIARSRQAEIPIVFTALRPGDKMEESLISTGETYAEERRGLLRTISSPMPEPATLDADFARLRHAVERRDLELLLEAVLRLVPEYQPSQLLREQLTAAAAVSA